MWSIKRRNVERVLQPNGGKLEVRGKDVEQTWPMRGGDAEQGDVEKQRRTNVTF